MKGHRRGLRALHAGLLAAACGCALAPAQAQDAPPRTALRVCQDPNNMPFSNTQGEGIENRIAELFGKSLGLPVTYYSFPQRMGFFRNTLRFKLPGQDYPCDIVMGVPVGLDEVSVTKPYYHSTYALVFARGKGMDHVASADDFLKLEPAKLKSLRIGVYDRSPGSAWLSRHGLLEQGVPYKLVNADPAQYPGEIVAKDLAEGKVDAVIVWGPIAGFFARQVKPTSLAVVPLKSEKGIKLDYQMAMGVRYGERDWKQQIEGLIESKAPEIQAILKEFGVPLVDASFEAPGELTAMPLAPTAVLCALLLALPGAHAEADKRDYSAAERLLFMAPQLRGVQPPTQLRYTLTKSGSLEPGFSDAVRVDLSTGPDGRCCDARGEFLSGARQEPAPEVTGAEANPVILYFLEHDLREMKRLTRGSTHHFRQRIRMAIYQGAEVREVSLRYQGRTVTGHEIEISPFLDDPNRPKYEKFARKRYRFTLSSAVPGGLVAIHTTIPDTDAAATPLIVEDLLLAGATAPAR